MFSALVLLAALAAPDHCDREAEQAARIIGHWFATGDIRATLTQYGKTDWLVDIVFAAYDVDYIEDSDYLRRATKEFESEIFMLCKGRNDNVSLL